MPAQFTIPTNGLSYTGAYNVFLDNPFDKPSEGYKRVPISILWGTDSRNGVCLIEMNGRVSEFPKIAGMFIDNTQSGADVQVVFQDSQFQFVCAAGEKDFFQVSSAQLNFALIATSALSTDKTFLQVYNYAPRPFGTYKSVFMATGIASGQNITGNSTSIIVPATANGTVTALDISLTGVSGGDATSQVTIQLIDGASNILWQHILHGVAGGFSIPWVTLTELSNLNIRFTISLSMTIVVAGTAFTSGVLNGTVYYRMP